MAANTVDVTATPITDCKTFKEISMWRKAALRVDQNSGNNLKGILSDIYAEPTHFMFELLQNADDASATKVRFEIENNKIVFRHNGTKDFSLEDIISITGIGNSTKTKSEKAIGKFGVGFKAVFAIAKTPKIWSRTFNFRIESLTVPYQIDKTELENWTTIFELEFESDKYSAKETYQRVLDEADTLDIQTILFMRHIRELEISTSSTRMVRLERTQHDGYSEFSDPEDGSRYLVFSGGENNRTSISYRIDAEDEIAVPRNTNVSVFFPTRVDSYLGFLVNAPFSTPRTRETIDFSDTYNPLLVDEAKAVFRLSIIRLRDLGLWRPDIIQDFMPINGELREKSPMYNYLFETLAEAFMQEELVPLLASGYERADKVVVSADRTISNLLTLSDNQWVAVSSSQNTLKSFYVNVLGITTIYFMDFIELCTEEYFKQQKANWLQEFYAYCSDHVDNRYMAEVVKRLKQQPIIRSRTGNFVPAYIGNSQNIFLNSKGLSDDRIVDKMFTSQSSDIAPETREKLTTLLGRLDIKARSPKSTIELDIMQKWEEADFDIRNQLFFQIVEIYNQSTQVEKEDIVTYLMEKDILFGTNEEWHSENIYQETSNLHLLFDGVYEVGYIHPDFWAEDYEEREITHKDGTMKVIKECQGSNELLEALGVIGGFKVERKDYGVYPYRFSEHSKVFKKFGVPVGVGNTRVEFTYEIPLFKEILANIDNREKSRALVDELVVIKDEYYEGEVSWYTSTRAYNRSSAHHVPSQFVLELMDAKWIFDRDDMPRSPSEVYEDDFKELYEISGDVKLLEYLDFKPSLRKSLPPKDQETLAMVDKLSDKELEEVKAFIRQMDTKTENANTAEIVWDDSTRVIVLDEEKGVVMTESDSHKPQVNFNTEPHDIVANQESAPNVRERTEKVAIKVTDNTKQLLGDYGEIQVLKYLRNQYGSAVEVPSGFVAEGKKYLLLGKTNPGYDIEVSADGEIIEYIEVKASTADSGSVVITHTEWEYAKQYGDKYTIYVISGINDDNTELHLKKYNNPYQLLTKGKISLEPESYRLS